MPQISLYIDKETLEKIESAANAENISISKWVGNHLKDALSTSYTSEFIELYGSCEDSDFEAPTELSWEDDAKRDNY